MFGPHAENVVPDLHLLVYEQKFSDLQFVHVLDLVAFLAKAENKEHPGQLNGTLFPLGQMYLEQASINSVKNNT